MSEISKDKENFIVENNGGGILKTKNTKKTIDCYYGNSYTVY